MHYCPCSRPLNPAHLHSVACPTTPTPELSSVTRGEDSAVPTVDSGTPTLERAGISAHTLATLRRGKQGHQARTQAAATVQSVLPPSVVPSVVTSRTRPPIHHTPNSDELDRTLAQLK